MNFRPWPIRVCRWGDCLPPAGLSAAARGLTRAAARLVQRARHVLEADLAGSALSDMYQNMGDLGGFRAVQGLGAGGLMVGVMAVLAEIVPPHERGKYQGVMLAVMPPP